MNAESTGKRSGTFAHALLAIAGLLFWFIVGLPWGPHNESFDWIVRLETMSLPQAAMAHLPSVLSLRPLGIALAWLTYHADSNDVALTQILNALFALAAWAWLAMLVPARRTFALVALLVGGVCLSAFIWVFHLHGIFYGPLLLFIAWLVQMARGPVLPASLRWVLVGAAIAALAHPYALPLAVVFAIGAIIEHRELRTNAGIGAALLVIAGCVGLYFLLVPGNNRDLAGDAWIGWRTSFLTVEVNLAVSIVAAVLAAWTTGIARGGLRTVLGFVVLLGSAILAAMHFPVLPVWVAAAAIVCMTRGRWTLATLLVAAAALPMVNPTGSPTYAVFALFLAVAASAQELEADEALGWLSSPVAAVAFLAPVVLALVIRTGGSLPLLPRLVQPLQAEGERTRQFTGLVDDLMRTVWRDEPMVFVRDSVNPAEADAIDRRFRAPTNNHHFQTWLDHRRGNPATGTDTLFFAFGGDSLAGGERVLASHGRFAGDALVFRRASARAPESVPAAATPATRP